MQPHARTCSIASWLLIPRAAPLAGPGRDRLPCTQAGGSRLCAGLVQLQAAWHGRYQKCPRRSGCVGRITPSRRPLLPHIACPVLHASLCARPLILRAAAPWQRVLGWQLCLYAARDGAPRAAASPPCPQRVSPCQRPPPPPPLSSITPDAAARHHPLPLLRALPLHDGSSGWNPSSGRNDGDAMSIKCSLAVQ